MHVQKKYANIRERAGVLEEKFLHSCSFVLDSTKLGHGEKTQEMDEVNGRLGG